MRIDDGVREAHLRHHCPGGLGVPVTWSGPIGLADGRGSDPPGGEQADDRRFRADGDCGRCGRPLAPGQDMRRTIDGAPVHETCPP